jgi:hypothetical protein
MEKVTLKLSEFYQLSAELEGTVNQQTGEVISKGLLHQKLNLLTKYWLNDLAKKVAAERESIEKLKEEKIKKYGKEDEKGNFSIPFYINEVKDKDGNVTSAEVNPDLTNFQNEFNELLEETREIEYKAFSIDILDKTESDANYPVFFKLLKVEQNA